MNTRDIVDDIRRQEEIAADLFGEPANGGQKFYIATGLANVAQHNALRDALLAEGHQITYDWTEHGPVWDKGLERIEEVGNAERKGVAHADVVFVLLPGGNGTHTELGMALAFGKRVIIYHETGEILTAHPMTCAFYHIWPVSDFVTGPFDWAVCSMVERVRVAPRA